MDSKILHRFCKNLCSIIPKKRFNLKRVWKILLNAFQIIGSFICGFYLAKENQASNSQKSPIVNFTINNCIESNLTSMQFPAEFQRRLLLNNTADVLFLLRRITKAHRYAKSNVARTQLKKSEQNFGRQT